MYEIFVALLEQKGCKASDVAKATGIHPSTFSDWKKGKSVPKPDKLKKIAEFFGVSVDYLLGVQTNEQHYVDDETARIAQEIFQDPDRRALFEASADCPPEYLRIASDMLRRLKETNPDG